jgi:hypothetical protein
MASLWERKGREGEGAWLGVRAGEREGCRRGAMGLAAWSSWLPHACSLTWLGAVREEGRRKERRKEKEGKEKREKREKNIKKFQT